MFLRPCFLIIDREFAGSISTRKLVIETAKFNVITAYSLQEAVATLERYPRLDGVVVSAGNDSAVAAFLANTRQSHPGVKLILTGHYEGLEAVCDAHLESYAPDKLLAMLRALFPDDSAKVEAIEKKLEDEVEKP